MTITIPDIDFDTASWDELKAHADVCAKAEMQLRAHTIETISRILRHERRSHEAAHVFNSPPRTKCNFKVMQGKPQRSVKEILGDVDVDELYNLDDFK